LYAAPLDLLSAHARQPPTADKTTAYAGTPLTQAILARNFDLVRTLLIDYGWFYALCLIDVRYV
jgi:hypothetical protein